MTNGNDAINNSEQGPQDGLTKREYFAAMAMQGICANHYAPNFDAAQIAHYAVQYADALITQLNKPTTND